MTGPDLGDAGGSHRFRRGDIIRIRDERWRVRGTAAYPAAIVLDVRGCDRGNLGVVTTFVAPFDRFDRSRQPTFPRVVTPRRWRRLARGALASATAACDALRTLAGARIDVLPFQLEPALALARGVTTRLLLADEVGLGKTVQAGLIIAETLERHPGARALIVTPAGLRRQWATELEGRFALAPTILDSTRVADSSGRLADANPWAALPLVITSVDFVKRAEVLRALESLLWDVAVFDEAHALTGRSDRHLAAAAIARRSRVVVMLTATPHSGDATAFDRLSAMGDLKPGFPLTVFRRTRADVGLKASRRSAWLRVRPSLEEAMMHASLTQYATRVRREQVSKGAHIAMAVLLKRACSSAASLARSIERRLSLLDGTMPLPAQFSLPWGQDAIDDDEPDLTLGAPGLVDGQDERRLLQDLLSVARLASVRQSKLLAVHRLIRRAREAAIVFTEYRDTLATLAAALHGFDLVQLHGGLSGAERSEVLHRFVRGDAQVLLATDAASEGLNLHHRCRLVVSLEVPWTPVRLEQRVGRVDRIGQQRRVHHVGLIAESTSERRVEELVTARTRRAEDALTMIRRRVLNEADVAESLLGGTPLGAPASSPGVVSAIPAIAVDVRDAAELEAHRAAVSRATSACQPTAFEGCKRSSGGDADATRDAFAATLHSYPSQAVCAFRLDIETADEELIWEALIGVSYQLPATRFAITGRSDVRNHLASVLPEIAAAASSLTARLLLDAQRGTRAAVTLGLEREDAMRRDLERTHARLAASVTQASLFDRRTERAAAAQARLLQEALDCSGLRLTRLRARGRPRAGRLEPLFALLRR